MIFFLISHGKRNYVVTPHLNSLIEKIQMKCHNIFFFSNQTSFFFIIIIFFLILLLFFLIFPTDFF